MSMPNTALRFQRDETGFNAEYRVTSVVMRDTQQVREVEHRETVRIGSFAETGRTEESIVFQDILTLQPGQYVVRLEVADLNSSRGFRAIDTVDVPAYHSDAKLGTPLLVYEAAGRERVTDRPDIILNPRNTIPYGAESPHVYLEMYGSVTAQPVSLRVVDDAGVPLWSGQATLEQGSAELRHTLVDVPSAALPIGRLWLEASETAGAKPQRLPLLVTISDQWMVANFDDVLRFLSLIAYPAELDSMRKAVGAERRARWEKFWTVRDPLPATPINEFRDQFFERIRIATDEFAESGRPGWETDRGEVFVVFGAPDHVIERQVGRDMSAQPNFMEWVYESLPGGRLVLQFIDRNGFGRYELTQSSEGAFRTVAARMRPKL
jgi:GWxTD domain-containing protein